MAGRPADRVIYVFDNFTFDVDKRELRAGERVVELQPQVFDVLEFLLANRDRMVTKDELLASVWRGRNVSDSTLASRINAVRSAIDDNGKDQRLIRTVLRKGFRFVGQAREVQTAASMSATTVESSVENSVGTPLALPKQTVTFCRTKNGVNLAVASVGSGPVVVRAGHWGTHVEYDLQNPLTQDRSCGASQAIFTSFATTGEVWDCPIGARARFRLKRFLMILKP